MGDWQSSVPSDQIILCLNDNDRSLRIFLHRERNQSSLPGLLPPDTCKRACLFPTCPAAADCQTFCWSQGDQFSQSGRAILTALEIGGLSNVETLEVAPAVHPGVQIVLNLVADRTHRTSCSESVPGFLISHCPLNWEIVWIFLASCFQQRE